MPERRVGAYSRESTSFPIPVTDLAVAKSFYGEILELGKPVYDLPVAGLIEFSSGRSGGNIAVTEADAESVGQPGVAIVFDVQDCSASVEHVRAKGVRRDNPVMFPGFVVFASFDDPFGCRLQMASPASTEPNRRRPRQDSNLRPAA